MDVVHKGKSPNKYPVRSFVAHPHGVVYYEMPKVASNSIHDTITRANANPHRIPHRFWFTFIRHPLSRLVSAYRNKIQTGKYVYLTKGKIANDIHDNVHTIEDFVDWLYNYDVEYYKGAISNHWCPQSWIVNSIPETLSFVGRLENMKEDWKVVMKQGLGDIPHLNKNKQEIGDVYKPWQEVLDKETEKKAREFYRDDFDKWPEKFWEQTGNNPD